MDTDMRLALLLLTTILAITGLRPTCRVISTLTRLFIRLWIHTRASSANGSWTVVVTHSVATLLTMKRFEHGKSRLW